MYLPHALKAATWEEAEGYKDQIPNLFAHMGRYYWEQGRSNDAEQLEIQVLKLQKEMLGERHPVTIRAMANLASTWWQQRRFDKAEQLNIQVLDLQKEVLGERHPNTILAMANLASTWRQQGRFDDAEQLQVEAVELYKKVLGAKHPDTIWAMENLTEMNRQSTSLDSEGSVSSSTQISFQEAIPRESRNRLRKWGGKLSRLGKSKKA